MIVNVDKLKEIIIKSTMNFSIDTCQLNFTKDSITSKMISFASDAVTILNVKNEVLPSLPKDDEIQFNFVDPNGSVMPYLSLIDGETIIKINPEKAILMTGNQTINLFFSSPTVVNTLASSGPKSSAPLLQKVKVTDDILKAFDKIKKIGSKFEKVYFGVDKSNFYIETTDKTNKFSNGLKINLSELKHPDMSMCFDYRNMFNMVSIIDTDFSIEYFFIKETNLGLLKAVKSDESESYFLMSKKEQ